jgi:uracil-DNA glycosylase family 4
MMQRGKNAEWKEDEVVIPDADAGPSVSSRYRPFARDMARSSLLPGSRPLFAALSREITSCRLCPRLVEWRETVAQTKVARFRDFAYWGRPVPGFGDPDASLLLVGLAPGAHGANRTGRMFTGDRSGDFLFAALHRAGLANQPTSRTRDDGLALRGVYIVAALRCAPPANAPSPGELARCAPFLDREVALLPNVRAVVALGAIAWRAYLDHLARSGVTLPRPRPAFAHGAEVDIAKLRDDSPRGESGGGREPTALSLIGSYHVSQQNTQTGKLTPAMFDAILRNALARAKAH